MVRVGVGVGVGVGVVYGRSVGWLSGAADSTGSTSTRQRAQRAQRDTSTNFRVHFSFLFGIDSYVYIYVFDKIANV